MVVDLDNTKRPHSTHQTLGVLSQNILPIKVFLYKKSPSTKQNAELFINIWKYLKVQDPSPHFNHCLNFKKNWEHPLPYYNELYQNQIFQTAIAETEIDLN